MSTRPPYQFTAHLEEGVLGRVWLNDLPVHKVLTRGPESLSGGANHMLVPGENTLTLEILALPEGTPPPPPDPNTPDPKHLLPVGFKIYQVVDASSTPMKAAEIIRVDLPTSLGLSPWERPEMPLRHEVRFELPDPVVEPVYWRSPPADFGCSGTPELISVVKELHDALMARDVGRFVGLLSLKYEAYSAAYPGEPAAAIDRQRSAAERFFKLPYVVKPLDFGKIHFEPRAQGRVALVSGSDDRPVIEAVAEGEPAPALRANLFLTRIDGSWRIFG